MNEVYRRKPAPPDWPRPEGIVIRQIDPVRGDARRTRLLAARSRSTSSPAPSRRSPCIPTGFGTGVDTTYGYPSPATPRCRVRRSRRTAAIRTSRPVVPSCDAIVIPGATPIPRASRPSRARATRSRTTFSRDSTRGRRATPALAARHDQPLHPSAGPMTAWQPTDCHAHSTSLRRRAHGRRDRRAGRRARHAAERHRSHLARRAHRRRHSRPRSSATSTISTGMPCCAAGSSAGTTRSGVSCPGTTVRGSPTASARCTPSVLANGRCFRAFSQPAARPVSTPHDYMEAHVASLEAIRGGDAGGHPRASHARPPAATPDATRTSCGPSSSEERAVAALKKAGIAFEISARYPPHERLVRRAGGGRRADLPRLRRPRRGAGGQRRRTAARWRAASGSPTTSCTTRRATARAPARSTETGGTRDLPPPPSVALREGALL